MCGCPASYTETLLPQPARQSLVPPDPRWETGSISSHLPPDALATHASLRLSPAGLPLCLAFQEQEEESHPWPCHPRRARGDGPASWLRGVYILNTIPHNYSFFPSVLPLLHPDHICRLFYPIRFVGIGVLTSGHATLINTYRGPTARASARRKARVKIRRMKSRKNGNLKSKRLTLQPKESQLRC